MSIPAWDASLPQRLLIKSYAESPADVLLRTSMDFGPAKVRRRGTAGPRPVSGSIIVTAAQLATFKTFFNTTLLGGALRFRWRDPIVDDVGALIASITGATANLSLVDGTAFISNPSTDLSSYEYAYIIVTDSAGKKAIGYIKAAGSGESYASPAWADDCADDGTADWSKADCTLAFDTDHYVVTYSDVTQHIYKTVTLGSGKLFKASVDVKNGTLSGVNVWNQIQTGLGSSVLVAKTGATAADWASLTGYVTAAAQGQVDVYSTMAGAGNYLLKNYSIKQVTAPSATGVTITSTPGGTTYNWASIESGFNYNDTSYDIAIYATEMRFTKTPSWKALSGNLFEIGLELEILP